MLNFYLPQRVLLSILLGLSLLVAITFIYVCWQWYDDVKLASTSSTQVALPTSDTTAALIASVPESHLFGKGVSGLPITSLQLLVTGIVKIDDEHGSHSKAYISISGQPSKIYQTGDELPGGVRLYDISNDTVILENDGELEKLPLPRQPLQFKAREPEE
ncbi:MAG: type II secretion system protein N [Gammaproteobacteria bacterium]